MLHKIKFQYDVSNVSLSKKNKKRNEPLIAVLEKVLKILA